MKPILLILTFGVCLYGLLNIDRFLDHVVVEQRPVKVEHNHTLLPASYNHKDQAALFALMDKEPPRSKDKRELGQISGKPKVYHPKTESERARLIADVWSLDTRKSMKIAWK